MTHPNVEDLRQSWMKSVGQRDGEEWAKEIFNKYEQEVLSVLRILDKSQADYTIGSFNNPLEKLDISKYSALVTETPIPLDRITLFKLDLDIVIAQELQKLSETRLAELYAKTHQSQEGKSAKERTEELHEEFTDYLGTPIPQTISQEKFIDSVKSGDLLQQAQTEKEVFLKQIRTYGTTLKNTKFIYPDPGKSYLINAKDFLVLLMKDEEYSDKDVLSIVEGSSLVTNRENSQNELDLDNAIAVFSIQSVDVPEEGILKMLNRFLVSGTFSIYKIDSSARSARKEVDREPFVTGESVLWQDRIIESMYNPVTNDYIIEVLDGVDW